MKLILSLVLLSIIIGLAYIRLAPSNRDAWHTDAMQEQPQVGHFVVRPDGGDLASPVYNESPVDLLTRFDAVALAEPRTSRLAGSPEEGRITYITRSRVIGFPDYTTVQATPVEGGTALVIHARLRFGRSDLGVNAARVTRWLDALVQG
ncbi:DUF1499 domain-containing protein [Cognatishimia sp. MH4019]|uniref:DUF1499 domain-containing protein n=1 Tax=Cognatishimia sp. MH4019 TaxID=2854030 RepID=UPI001CD76755|nr:DUF1499 domain-containing protein [Cognatishimia sp. MH4019]